VAACSTALQFHYILFFVFEALQHAQLRSCHEETIWVL